MRTTRIALAALALAGVVATGCGSSSNGGGGPDSSTDSPVMGNHDAHMGTDGHVNHPDGMTGIDGPIGNPETGPTPEGGVDGGPCIFQNFVIKLYMQTPNSTPSTDLGQNCTDNGMFITGAQL